MTKGPRQGKNIRVTERKSSTRCTERRRLGEDGASRADLSTPLTHLRGTSSRFRFFDGLRDAPR